MHFSSALLIGAASVAANPFAQVDPASLPALFNFTNVTQVDPATLPAFFHLPNLNFTQVNPATLPAFFHLPNLNFTLVDPASLPSLFNLTNSNFTHLNQTELMNRFRVYFVNNTQVHPEPPSWFDRLYSNSTTYANKPRPSMWNMTSNFFKNQANAFVGALMSPFRVGSKAMVTAAQEHKLAVAEGTAYAQSHAHPYLMAALGLPNQYADYAFNVSNSIDKSVETYEKNFKDNASSAVEHGVENVKYGVENAQRITNQYIVGPAAGFVGNKLSNAGGSLNNSGFYVSDLGSNVSSKGKFMVSSGGSVVLWSIDPAVVLPGEEHN